MLIIIGGEIHNIMLSINGIKIYTLMLNYLDI